MQVAKDRDLLTHKACVLCMMPRRECIASFVHVLLLLARRMFEHAREPAICSFCARKQRGPRLVWNSDLV